MNENKTEEVMEELFKKTNTLLGDKMSEIESSISNIKILCKIKTLTSQKIRLKQS